MGEVGIFKRGLWTHMDICPYIFSYIGNHNRCTSNCVGYNNVLDLNTRPAGNSSSSSRRDKTTFQEDLRPSRGNTPLFSIGPSIAVISILLSYSVLPFSNHLVLADLNIGGLRAAAQSISYEIPLTLCVLSILYRAIR
ncbi:unnamed protein product [Thlaspi arvense]|uniref:Uncharacterized protein n=1 Tax=Thlaspi arvense TaxID=13288 RepID=A0AAU9RWT7_THLAR|nr:unnamed protein product [Thlaspi arvense]